MAEPLDLALRRRRLQRPLHRLAQLAPDRSRLARRPLAHLAAHGARRVPHEPLPGDLARLRRCARSSTCARPAWTLQTLSIHRARPPDLLSPRPTGARPRPPSACCPTSVGRSGRARTSTRSCARRAATCRRSALALAHRRAGSARAPLASLLLRRGDDPAAPLPPRRHRAHPRPVRRQRDRRGDARHALPPRPARRRRGMLMEPRRPRLGRVLQRDPVRAGGQARARALRGRDQRLRPQPAHAAQRRRALAAYPRGALRRRSATSTCRRRSASSCGPAAEVLFVGRLLHGKGLSLLFEAIAELRRRGLDVERDHRRRRAGARGVREPSCSA